MKALTWQGKGDVQVRDVPDPRIQESTDAIIQVTSTAICGSDLHLYEVLGPFLSPGDVLGHETMGVVQEVGADVHDIAVGDRVVIPFNISCGSCWMCTRGLMAACETTQVREQGKGAALFGYTELYGSVPGGQAELLRVPQAHFGPIKVPEGVADERFLYLSDILPTAWQGVAYAEVPPGGTLAVFGLGPVGQLACRIAVHRGLRVIGLDLVPERLALAQQLRRRDHRHHRGRRPGPGGARADGRPGRGRHPRRRGHGGARQSRPRRRDQGRRPRPRPLAKPMIKKVGVDRLAALQGAISAVRRGGSVSVSGVYGGMVDPMPMMEMFDKGISLRMGQCHVKRWIGEILPVVMEDGDVLGLESLATHRLPLAEAARGYDIFQKKSDGCVKVVLEP